MMDCNKAKKTVAIVLAGGKGTRMGGNVQKQYLQLQGKPLLVHALEAFECSQVDEIVIVAGNQDLEYVQKEIVETFHISKVRAVVAGGAERYHSVYEGLKAADNCDIVLIHDGARPLVTNIIIDQAIKGAKEWQACVVGMPVKDTIKMIDDDQYSHNTPDRRFLWQVQTPQAFSYDLIMKAYHQMMADVKFQEGVTDDAMVVEQQMDKKIKLIEGSYENIKVTTPEDLIIAEAILRCRSNQE